MNTDIILTNLQNQNIILCYTINYNRNASTEYERKDIIQHIQPQLSQNDLDSN